MMKFIKFITLPLILGFLVLVAADQLIEKKVIKHQPKVDLPEEYMLIDKNTPITGYMDKDSILHIEFDHSIQFKWEGLERDIPQDGVRQLQLSTNENTVYLNPVDE